jgi:saccharopine dehydrogenase-like NADP-dependent oxidoreductase
MKALVIGAGKMGIPIAYALNKLGFEVTQVDLFESHLNEAADKYRKLGCQIDLRLQSDIFLYRTVDFDVCVSAANYAANYTWAEWCKERKVPYCDLGGNNDISRSIQTLSQKLNPEVPVFTDLGLAPGLLNILGESIYNELLAKGSRSVKEIKLKCGGLPFFRYYFLPLEYSVVFSVLGLKNEYSGKCQMLRNGSIVEEDALSGCEAIVAKSGDYEAFHTSGGLSTTLEVMQARGVQELDYKTIRYPGHCKQIQNMMNSMDERTFIESIKKKCPPTNQDWVLIQVHASSVDPVQRSIGKEIEIHYNDDWTAMQQGTAFPAAAVAAMMADKRWKQPVLGYHDIPFEEFSQKLIEIGFVGQTRVTESEKLTKWQKIKKFLMEKVQK